MSQILRFSPPVLVLLSLVFGGCAATSGAKRSNTHDLTGSVWMVTCHGCSENLLTHYVELREGGEMAFNNDEPRDWFADGDDTWERQGDLLKLIWANGYSTNTYDLSGPQGELGFQGDKDNVDGPVYLLRIR